ncbi:hypothetical protein C3B44_03255 [Corynebacterium yudongzhengii]|uniref:Glycine transporter domain-containing protein n=1 Tax=Corynebacterium yudongzhengii TaxID=2080740 RepID=A0A2U1T7S3_9CORY|nr:trimeric intracellular cation channel family protein [Corynebacterium yudongzhengii]AWB81491.1 hypothetical protein C3B44_03255 [Corynebacterium yudongzhengii]PWC01938.1 hypothetical protein DF222_04990 [Corynebacterium yudongzhengii]
MDVAEVDPQILLIYRVFDVSGVLLMGIIGGTIARQRGYDIVGFLFIALFSALGGGMIRDVLINRGTVAAMSTPEYLILAFTGAMIARFIYFKGQVWERAQAHGDATVSGLWAATGCVKAMTFDLPVLACVMMGVFTAVGGGMVRDVVTGNEPSVFGNNQPTVLPAIVTTVVVLIADSFGFLAIGMVVGPIIGIALTIYGYWSGWRLKGDSEWAPVNAAARKVERGSRKVAREVEPRRIRAWRHRQMEKALERRQSRAEKSGLAQDPAADAELREQLYAELDAALEEEAGFGVDFGGDSYENYDTETQSDTTAFDDVVADSDDPADHAEDVDPGTLIDRVLADDAMADELLNRLAERYREREDN